MLGASFDAEDLVDRSEIDGIGGEGVESVGRNGNNGTAIQPRRSITDDMGVRIGCADFENLGRQAVPYLF